MSLLHIEELKAGYGKKSIINDISLEIKEGQIVGILGPNGCGKSTLIKALCKGIPSEGVVRICEQDAKALTEKELAKLCAYVPQSSGISIDISALEVVLMGFYPYMGLLERPNAQMKQKACELLNSLGLEKEIDSNYLELSEGQKRMCILARSLVTDSKLFLMDEPDASLDFNVRNHLLQRIKKQVKDGEAGALLSLHDTDLALLFCDKIHLMRDGVFIDVIKPQEDLLQDMEQKLQRVYGNIRLLEYQNENGTRKIVMVHA